VPTDCPDEVAGPAVPTRPCGSPRSDHRHQVRECRQRSRSAREDPVLLLFQVRVVGCLERLDHLKRHALLAEQSAETPTADVVDQPLSQVAVFHLYVVEVGRVPGLWGFTKEVLLGYSMARNPGCMCRGLVVGALALSFPRRGVRPQL
jgi:hypothetical protein